MSVLVSVEHLLRRQGPVLRPVVLRAIKVALVVGTCLTLINQGDALMAGTAAHALWWKVPLTYLVPLCVSTYSALAAMQSRR